MPADKRQIFSDYQGLEHLMLGPPMAPSGFETEPIPSLLGTRVKTHTRIPERENQDLFLFEAARSTTTPAGVIDSPHHAAVKARQPANPQPALREFLKNQELAEMHRL